jgi:hypothetical protein
VVLSSVYIDVTGNSQCVAAVQDKEAEFDVVLVTVRLVAAVELSIDRLNFPYCIHILRVVNKWISIVLTGINGIVACYFSWVYGS